MPIKKLAIVITHPIQYYVPVFRLLAQNLTIRVFYTWGDAGNKPKIDPGFGKKISWDIPLLDGYDYEFLTNTSKEPGSHHFSGIKNPDILDRIKTFKPDALLVYGWSYSSHLKVLKYFKGKVPVWFRGDSTLLDVPNGLKNSVKTLVLKWVYRHIDKAFYVGGANKTYFQRYGLKESQLVFAPHAIDNERFSEERKQEADTLRNSLGIGDEDILFLFAGKLEPKKNPELLLEAFVELMDTSTSMPNGRQALSVTTTIHLLFAGSGVLEERLKLKAESSKLKACIHFMDFQNQTQMPVVYQACDVFCLPSKGPGETWGLAVNETMAAGKAVLVSNKVGCAKDLVKDGINGYIFQSSDAADLKNKMELVCDKKKLQVFGNNSVSHIRNWSFDSQVKAIIEELERL